MYPDAECEEDLHNRLMWAHTAQVPRAGSWYAPHASDTNWQALNHIELSDTSPLPSPVTPTFEATRNDLNNRPVPARGEKPHFVYSPKFAFIALVIGVVVAIFWRNGSQKNVDLEIVLFEQSIKDFQLSNAAHTWAAESIFTEEKIEKYHDMMIEIFKAAKCEKDRNRAAYYDMMSLLGASIGDLIPYLHGLAGELKDIGDQVYEITTRVQQHTTRWGDRWAEMEENVCKRRDIKKRISILAKSIETGILKNLGDYHNTALEVWYRAEYYEGAQRGSPKSQASGLSVYTGYQASTWQKSCADILPTDLYPKLKRAIEQVLVILNEYQKMLDKDISFWRGRLC